ncbi:hypothetical protein [Limnobacter sp.]|uniref:hypothetical protein n=1 Tax=Limnobacter sp. TaxID=2003368 RepID=UPI0025C42ACE|nr:hypothetical protein [Limnobacter sp.]
MEKLLEQMGFRRSDIDVLGPEIEKFVSAENEIQKIKKDIRTIKISLILIVGMLALLIVS